MSISSKIQSLITAANTVTGQSRTDLTAAVQDLKDGYGGGGLPAEYEAVDYIESTGTQYIDTGFIPDKYSSVRCKFSLTQKPSSTSTYCFLWGCSVSGVTSSWFGAPYNSSQCQFIMVYNGNGYYYTAVNVNEIVTASFGGGSISVSNSTANYYLAKNQTPGNINDFNNSSQLSLFLFAMNDGGNPELGEGSYIKLYKCQIFNNATGEMYRNFVPCIRKADDEAGLYDLVNGVFYTNQGTGDFIVPT